MRFWKYQGLGNDFVIFDHALDPSPEWTTRICDRRWGVGADGILTMVRDAAGRSRMTVYNADGSRPEMCGNGLRCAARWLMDTGQVDVDAGPIAIDTDAGARTAWAVGAQVAATMGRVTDLGESTVDLPDHAPIRGHEISVGNPHFVIFDASLNPAVLGPLIERAPRFPRGTNVSFAELVPGTNRIRLVVWERGCGLTLACGTAACATAGAAWLAGRLKGEVEVELPGGSLLIGGDPDALVMTGPAECVYAGTLSA